METEVLPPVAEIDAPGRPFNTVELYMHHYTDGIAPTKGKKLPKHMTTGGRLNSRSNKSLQVRSHNFAFTHPAELPAVHAQLVRAAGITMVPGNAKVRQAVVLESIGVCLDTLGISAGERDALVSLVKEMAAK